MWSTPMRGEEEKKEEINTITDAVRNVRYLHLQISTPKVNNKTRASKVKEALMIIFATSKHIKLHPKEKGKGEIITNIGDMVTTEEFTNQYFFDKKMGKKYVRGEGQMDYYITKVRLESDINLNQMKWQTSTKFLEVLKTQNIFLKEYQDGKIMRTGNLGWLSGLNPNNSSIAKVTNDLNGALKDIDATAIIDIHTVSIRFPQTKKAFVTRAFKVMCDIDKLNQARGVIQREISENNMGVGWKKVQLVNFDMDKQGTAMMIENHNKLLHNTAVVAIKNIWSITERDREITEEVKRNLGMNTNEDIDTIEDMWWSLANRYKQDVQGMVTRRGTLEILTTRKNLDDTVGFARELVTNTVNAMGEEQFARLTANHNINARQPAVQEAPMVLSGRGRVKLDTTNFTEEEFKNFAEKHGIPLGKEKNSSQHDLRVDLSRPPKAFYHKPGREPVEQDPKKMREGAIKVWEHFTENARKNNKKNAVDRQETKSDEQKHRAMVEPASTETTSETIARMGKITRLDSMMNKMKESQDALERSTAECNKKIKNIQQATENNMERMNDMIENMGNSITAQNKQLEAQAKAQVKQAEDIETIMKAIQAISKAVQVTPSATQYEDTDEMQVDIADSNKMKRKQTSLESTTLLTEETLGSTMTSSTTASSQFKGMHGTGRQ
jgi:hypothetical protein